jgi:hypothetical protein
VERIDRLGLWPGARVVGAEIGRRMLWKLFFLIVERVVGAEIGRMLWYLFTSPNSLVVNTCLVSHPASNKLWFIYAIYHLSLLCTTRGIMAGGNGDSPAPWCHNCIDDVVLLIRCDKQKQELGGIVVGPRRAVGVGSRCQYKPL